MHLALDLCASVGLWGQSVRCPAPPSTGPDIRWHNTVNSAYKRAILGRWNGLGSLVCHCDSLYFKCSSMILFLLNASAGVTHIIGPGSSNKEVPWHGRGTESQTTDAVIWRWSHFNILLHESGRNTIDREKKKTCKNDIVSQSIRIQDYPDPLNY